MMQSIVLALFLLSVHCIDYVDDEFRWPEWPQDYKFKTWSGLIPLDDSGVIRNLHYVFVESQTEDAEVATQPVILWLNGGPGCSSMLGLMQEIGPFVIDNGETDYKPNPWSWNVNAHLLILESPFGVGFSQPTPDDKYEYTDQKSGQFNYQAVRKWFDTFTYYRGRDFYIAGESYAGLYVPYTAQALLNGEKDVAVAEKIQFKGIMIGNGVLINDGALRAQAANKFLVRRSFIDQTNQFILNHNCAIAPQSSSCRRAQLTLDETVKQLNPYGVYSYCWGDSTKKEYKLERKTKNRFVYTPWLKLTEDDDDSSAPCIDFGPLANKLNQDNYKQAFHVDVATTWTGCSDPVYAQYTRSEGSYLIIPDLFQAGVKILIFSGDQDLAVSTVETQDSLKKIPGIQIVKKWTPYKNNHQGSLNGQLAGWIEEYNYLRFQVIRGAGHMVPQDQRENAWFMIDAFINPNP